MEIAMGAIGPLLPKLAGLLEGEFTLEKRVRKGVESLLAELTLMQAALRKVVEVPREQLDEGGKIWAGMVRELSYQMEDIVDAFLVRVEDGGESTNPKNRVKKLLKKTKRLFKKGKDLHHISDALEEVLAQAKQLAELRQRWYAQEKRDASAGASIDPRLKALYEDATKLVGIEEPRDELVNLLTEDDDWSNLPLKTISIVGFGGLGKTTLAKAIYDKIKGKFNCSAFVSVSQNPNMKKVFKDILYELDEEAYKETRNDMDELQHINKLLGYLKDKRYIIVIDDIWNEETWEVINYVFSNKSPGSRLITTTRILSVAEACCPSHGDIYRMKPLSEDVSRKLFYKRVFPHEKVCPQELVQVSRDILKKCGGVPLAIITIASLLANKHEIKAKDQWYSLLNSIGRGLTEDRSLKQMQKILLFSYYDLPSYLKPCLLYLSIFPEDHQITRSKLIWRWISEGLIYSDKQETSLYELGNSHFNELVNRSMIQLTGNVSEEEEKVEDCRVHDMVLALICSLSSEENFVTILDDTGIKMPNWKSKVHRLSIQNSKIDVHTSRMAHMRSLTVFTNNVVGKVLDISSFHVLRVLDLEGCDVSDVGYVGNMLHLRYLGLKDTQVEDLPVGIGKLQFLLTLDIRGTKIKVLPSSVLQLRRLMCLYVDHNMKMPSVMSNLTSLEVVGDLRVSSTDLDVVNELGHLANLRVLGVLCDCLDEISEKALDESLSGLCKLESLEIEIFTDDEWINFMRDDWVPPAKLRKLDFPSWESRFKTLPKWISTSSLPLLTYLCITVHKVQWEHIHLLGMMHALCVLEITDYSKVCGEYPVEMPTLSSGALFQCATVCRFHGIGAVPSMFPQGAAPRLKFLEFRFSVEWVSGENLDLGMRHLPCLERLDVTAIGEEASDWEVDEAESALRGAVEDHPNHPVLYLDVY